MGDKEKGIMDLEEYVKLTGDLKTKEMINELKSVDDSPKFMKSLKWNEYGKGIGYDMKYGSLKTECKNNRFY